MNKPKMKPSRKEILGASEIVSRLLRKDNRIELREMNSPEGTIWTVIVRAPGAQGAFKEFETKEDAVMYYNQLKGAA